MGLLDIDTPQGQGLLAAAFSLMGAQKMPGERGIGNALGQAGMNYMQARSAAMPEYLRRQQEQQRQAQEQARRAALPSLMQGGKIDYLGALQEGYTPEQIKAMAELPNAGRSKVARTIKGIENGREVEYQVDEYGQRKGDGMVQYRAPLEVALGDRKSFIDPFSLGSVADFKMGQSPDSRASVAATMRGQNMTDARARERFAFDQGGGGEFGGSQASLVKQFGKPSAGYRWKADGSQEFIPGGPADQKAQLQKSGEGSVGSVVADLRDKYTQLNDNNGIVSTQNRFGTNIGARIGSTGIGQAFGGAVGTKNQSARESIAMTRPILLQAIMRATGMSAKQMDSNAELKLYLSTATDPTLGFEANMRALDRIEQLFGGGVAEKPETTEKPDGRTVVKTGTYQGKKVTQYSDGSIEYAN